MPRPRPLAWSGVRSGAQHGTSGVRSAAQHGMSGVRSGAQPAQSDVRSGAPVPIPPQVQLPAQLSNSTGWAKALIEPAAPSTARTEMVDVAARPWVWTTSCLLRRGTRRLIVMNYVQRVLQPGEQVR